MTMKTGQLKTYGCSKSSSTREIYSNTVIPQETRKASNRQPKFTPKTTEIRRTTPPQNSRRKEKLSPAQIKETTYLSLLRIRRPS